MKLTVATSQHAVDAKARVLLLDLARLDGSQRLDGAQTRVLGKSQGNCVQSISEGTHSVLLDARALQKVEKLVCDSKGSGWQCTNLDGSILHSNRAGNLGSTTTVDDAVVTDQVADNTQGIV